jgi:hypothetical protein
MSVLSVSPTYVLKSWKFAGGRPVDETGCLVHFTGRSRGFVAWFLSLVGVDPTFSLRVYPTAVFLETSSVFGNERRMMPLRSLTAISGGLTRPLAAAFVVLLIAMSIVPFVLGAGIAAVLDALNSGREAVTVFYLIGLLIGAVVAVSIAIFYYGYYKSITVQFVESSGITSGVVFMPSFIEGVKVDERAAWEVTSFVEGLLLEGA